MARARMMGRLLRGLGGLCVALALFLGLGELLARGLDVVDRLNGYGRELFAPGPDADMPYRLRPGIAATLFGLPVSINALGLRGPETTPEPAPGVRRVLVVGDSVVFGQGVAGDPLPALLAQALAAVPGTRWEVLNAGVPGWDAVAEARFVETAGLALRPAMVVVGTSLNDYDPTPAYSPLGVLTRQDVQGGVMGVVQRSEFLMLLRWMASFARGTLGFQLEDAARRARATAPPPASDAAATADPQLAALADVTRKLHLGFYHAPDPARWDRLRDGLRRLRDATAAARVPLLVAIVPEAYQVGVATPDLEPQRRLLALCTELALTCVDLQPAFAAAGGTLFVDTQHPDARGLALTADVLAPLVRAAVAP